MSFDSASQITRDLVLRQRMALVMDGECENSRYYLEALSQQGLFYENYFWLIETQAVDKLVVLFQNSSLFVNADILVAVGKSMEKMGLDIYEVYNPSNRHGGSLKISKVGSYEPERGFNISWIGEKYWRRKNMTGLTFKSAIVTPKPEEDLDAYLANEKNREINSMHRFQSVTIRHCKDFYNFSLNMQRTNSWGYKQANGKFDGLVSLLENNIIDFGSSPLLFKEDRLPFVDYSYGNWKLRSAFIFKKPKKVADSYTIFLRPLDIKVWILILIFMGIILINLRISFGMGSVLFSHDPRVESSWSILVLFIIGAFCQQASIVSYIILDPPSSITNLQDLLDSNLEAGVEDILIDRNYFVQTKDPVAIELYNKKVNKFIQDNSTGFYEPSSGLSLVRGGGFAFHVETSTAYPIIQNTFSNQDICDLEEIQMYRTQPMHTNLPKHSPLKEMMNYCMLRLVESGVMFRLRRFWDAKKPECIETAKKIEIRVSFKEFSFSIIILTSGVFITLIILLMEVLMSIRKTIGKKISRTKLIQIFKKYLIRNNSNYVMQYLVIGFGFKEEWGLIL
ncbi:ionotropic receptor 75a-like isoform X2 [Harmonia axyridis]|uniref:ionotropic receptor 75a-like isoform X2 n=1 Tax=Harmonia axyridis TaxID=115357 RepID=UPI001E278131|nr:ionotropic receptor 75a-like isoform X2 [Harmonia axyridis]